MSEKNIKIKNFVTESGFECNIDTSLWENMELVDDIAELSAGNFLKLSNITKMILGDENKKKLYNHVRIENGTVPPQLVEKELMEIFASQGEIGKN